VVIKLDIGLIPEGSSHLDLSADASELGVEMEGGGLQSPVTVSLDVNRTGNDIFLRGKANVTAMLECARCLDEYTLVLEVPVELWCLVASGTDEKEAGVERENVIEVPVRGKYVDLSDYLRSELLVVVPLKPLCKPDCQGLCPRCGANLNAAGCSCETEGHDNRWDALKKIK
jgi:uncharacterized protein